MSRWSLQSLLVSGLLIKTQLSWLLMTPKKVFLLWNCYFTLLITAQRCYHLWTVEQQPWGAVICQSRCYYQGISRTQLVFRADVLGCVKILRQSTSVWPLNSRQCWRITVLCSCFQHLGVLKCWAAQAEVTPRCAWAGKSCWDGWSQCF